MHYRLYKPDDFAALYAVEERCFAPPLRFGRRHMRRQVENAQGVTWIAEEGGVMAGFGIADWAEMRAQKLAYIETLEVLPEFRRRGVGAELLRRLEDAAQAAGAKMMWLHVDVENDPAVRMYEARGYGFRTREEDYYGNGRAAAVYSKELDSLRAAP